MRRTAQLYLIIVSIAGLSIFFILHVGSQLPPPVSPLSADSAAQIAQHVTVVGDSSFLASIKSSLRQNGTSPLSRLFLQLSVIIIACYVVGWVFRRLGHPAVVGR